MRGGGKHTYKKQRTYTIINIYDKILKKKKKKKMMIMIMIMAMINIILTIIIICYVFFQTLLTMTGFRSKRERLEFDIAV